MSNVINKEFMVFVAAIGLVGLVNAARIAKNANQNIQTVVTEKSLGEAEFVFVGTVNKVDYRSSSGKDKGFAELPHTFVTYSIEKVLKGVSPGKTITLRFLGGKTHGGQMMVSDNYPLFDVGNRDLLLVKGNGEFACPLAGCENGRFRIVDNGVFLNDGREVLMLAGTGPIAGARSDRPELNRHKVGDVTIAKVSVNDPQDKNTSRKIAGAVTAHTDAFVLYVADAVSAAPDLSERAVLTADPDKAFFVAAPVAQPPPAVNMPAERVQRAPTESEQRELESYRANGNNPVLPAR